MTRGPFKASVVPIDWLRTTRRNFRNKPHNDIILMRTLLGSDDREFETGSFERIFDLQPLETKRIQIKKIARAMKIPDSVRFTTEYIRVDKMGEKIIAPEDRAVSKKLDKKIIDVLAYMFTRMILKRIPNLERRTRHG